MAAVAVLMYLRFADWDAVISVIKYQMLDHSNLANLVSPYCTVIKSDGVSLWMSAWLCSVSTLEVGCLTCHRESKRDAEIVSAASSVSLWSWWVSHTPAGRGWDFGCHGDALRLVHCTHSLALARSNSESHQIWLTLHKHRISRHQTPLSLCGIIAKWKYARNSVINIWL